MTANILHSSATQEHPTPPEICAAAREVLGRVQLDPASSREYNAQHIHAERIYDRPVDGLTQPWWGTVFLNPPGGTFTARRKNATDPPVETSPVDAAHRERWQTDSRAVAWWRKLVTECDKPAPDDVTAAIFVGFTLEILQSAQDPRWLSPMHFPFCVPAKRLKFGGDQPTHANVIVYIGPDVEKFARVFSQFGMVKT
jgi:hypothetical protein